MIFCIHFCISFSLLLLLLFWFVFVLFESAMGLLSDVTLSEPPLLSYTLSPKVFFSKALPLSDDVESQQKGSA